MADPFDELAVFRKQPESAGRPQAAVDSVLAGKTGRDGAGGSPKPAGSDKFVDLIPAELVSTSSRPAAAPMRPTALREGATQAPAQPSLVDGVPQAVLDQWFDIADSDRDGRVANTEAVEFLLQSGLSPVELRRVYLRVKTPELNAKEGVGLTKLRFAQVLRLIALVQSGLPFTEANAAAALDPVSWLALHGQPLPPPRIVLRSAAAHSATQPTGATATSSFAFSSSCATSMPGGSVLHTATTPSAPGHLAAGQLTGAAWPAGNPFASPSVPAQDASAATAVPSSRAGKQATATYSAAQQGPDWQGLDLTALETLVSPPPRPAAADVGHATLAFSAHQSGETCGTGAQEDEDLFGLDKLALQGSVAPQAATTSDQLGALRSSPLQERQPSGFKDSLRRLDRRRSAPRYSPTEAPLAFEARLPPLNPKLSAKLCMLAAGSGSLFAGPGTKTGVLQWAQPEGNLQQPVLVGSTKCQGAGTLDALEGYEPGAAAVLPRVDVEDLDAAPSAEVHVTSRKQASCMMLDDVANILWVGDKDGMVSGYDIGAQPGTAVGCVGSMGDAPPQQRLYQWEAYGVGSVVSMCVTPSGELWTGSSRGNIRVWQLQPKSVGSGSPMEEPLVCRELRKLLGERPHGGAVLALVCSSDGQLVWSTSGKTILLWDAASGAFTGVVQKVIGRLGSGMVIDHAMGQAEALLKYNINIKKGLEVDSLGFILRKTPSERAKMQGEQAAWAAQTDKGMNEFVERMTMGGSKMVQGAGKAMKMIGKFSAKVARKGLGGPDSDVPSSKNGSYNSVLEDDIIGKGGKSMTEDRSSRICALIATHDNHVWVGYKKGRLDSFTSVGKLEWSKEIAGNLQTMCSVGQHVWVGFANGTLSILDAEGAALKVFSAHSAGIISMAQAGTRMYTLAADGSIKGWSSALPQEADVDALMEWDELASSCIRHEVLHMLCVTWNVGESKPAPRSPFFTQLDGKVNSTDRDIQLVVVGLQEIEMGGSSVALAAAKDALSCRLQERGNSNAKFWGAGILDALGADQWYQVALRQLSGMLVLVFARRSLKNCIGEVATASVACGVLGVGGNKGAVAVEFTLHRRRVAVVCSHFAAHQKAVLERNANYEQIVKQLTFKRKPWFMQGSDGEEEDTSDVFSQGSKKKLSVPLDLAGMDEDARSQEGSEGPGTLDAGVDLIQGEGMRHAKLLIWMGDFNYRIDEYSYLEVKEQIQRENWDALLEKDQCRQQVAAGNVFRGLQEGPIRFRPTYKFDPHVPNPEAYDTSEKQRIPAWCDRVFFRGSPQEEERMVSERVTAEALEYNAWLDVLDSDHKPVYARLEVNLPVTNREKKRHICSQLLNQCVAASQPEGPPQRVHLQPLQVVAQPQGWPVQGVRLSNGGQDAVQFRAVVDRTAAAGLRYAVDVQPVSGLVQPGESMPIYVLLSPLDPDALLPRDAKVVVEPKGMGKDGGKQQQVEIKVMVQAEYSTGSEGGENSTAVLPLRVDCGKM